MTQFSSEIKCPVCKASANKLYNVDRTAVEDGISEIFQFPMPPSILTLDYAQYRCKTCTLEFSWPLVPGSSEFYNFLTSQNGYYTDYRPEYKILWDLLKKRNGTSRILDVGCGDGSFLAGTLSIPGIKAIGIDTTSESVDKAKSKGLEAYQTNIEDLDQKNFDVIVSFHCLEHVTDPLAFINSIKMKLNKGGEIYISTPYSPTSYEYYWFHPLNHPPHHLYRLNKKAYETIAAATGLKIEFTNFEKMSFRSHFASCFSFARFGRMQHKGLKLQILLNPILSLKVFIQLIRRGRMNGSLIGNDILVKLSR